MSAPTVEPDYVTESDVDDYATARLFVRCVECDLGDQAAHMCLQSDGEYFCPGCHYGERN